MINFIRMWATYFTIRDVTLRKLNTRCSSIIVLLLRSNLRFVSDIR